MGNCIRRCIGDDDSENLYTPAEHYYPRPRYSYGYGGHEGGGYPGPRPGPVTFTVVGYTAFARDLLAFETTNQVPEALSQYVSASGAIQRIWYMKLLAAWKRTNPAPASAEAVAVLIIQTLQGCFDIQGLLRFYRLPWPTVPVVKPVPLPATQPVPEPAVPVDKPDREKPEASGILLVTPEAAEGVQYTIHTLPVEWVKDKGDGDGFTVYVNVLNDAREAGLLPKAVQEDALSRCKARARKNYEFADALQKKIKAANYRVFDGKDGGACCLARKYKIRLRGVDAPEIEQPYGEEARDLLRSLVKGQQLVIHVYGTDKFDREVGDIYCNGLFIQEELLKKGSVWHFEHFDKRKTFAEWQMDAKEACIGLWADPNPEAPWDYRKKYRKKVSFRRRGA